jgi:hypothetical protein
MKLRIFSCLLLVPVAQIAADRKPSIEAAAAKYFPDVSWRGKSVVAADFTCRGRKEWAILGASRSEIVVAVFLKGPNRPPVVVHRDSVRNRTYANLKTEDLDFEPKDDPGYVLPGFRRSKTCKGLNVTDNMIDSAHIYWNHEARQFDNWSR